MSLMVLLTVDRAGRFVRLPQVQDNSMTRLRAPAPWPPRHRRHLRTHRRTPPGCLYRGHLEPGTDRVDRPDGRRPPRPVRHRPAPVRRLRTRSTGSPTGAGRNPASMSAAPLPEPAAADLALDPGRHGRHHHPADAGDPGPVVPSHWPKGGPITLANDTQGQ